VEEDDEDSEFFNRIDDGLVDNVQNDLCNDDRVDAMLTMTDGGGSYIFKDSRYWKMTDAGLAPGYPKQISEGWEGLPDNIDAAFSWKNGKTYILKGNRYWRYSADSLGKLDQGFPKKISRGFDGIPNNVDAALVWAKNEKIYFFKGSNYWKFDPSNDPPVEDSYPRPISNWDGIPDSLDAAMRYSNDNTYFFKDGQYYRFNGDTFTVDTEGPSYPRDTGTWWFGCQDRFQKQEINEKFILD